MKNSKIQNYVTQKLKKADAFMMQDQIKQQITPKTQVTPNFQTTPNYPVFLKIDLNLNLLSLNKRLAHDVKLE